MVKALHVATYLYLKHNDNEHWCIFSMFQTLLSEHMHILVMYLNISAPQLFNPNFGTPPKKDNDKAVMLDEVWKMDAAF